MVLLCAPGAHAEEEFQLFGEEWTDENEEDEVVDLSENPEPEEPEEPQEPEGFRDSFPDDDEGEDDTALDRPRDDDDRERRSPSERRRLTQRWFWSAFSFGLAAGVGAAVAGALTLSLNEQYLAEQRDPLLRDRGMAMQLATNIFIGVAGGFALIATLFAIFTDWGARPVEHHVGGYTTPATAPDNPGRSTTP